ncbi:MAG: nucleotidyltransferase domain-containing protein [Candidatus Hydrogenedentes bacterium]|nr:nucleotidyltransferase domain-containing protein [Candidatus Hydrogenedentota bacterium]
MRDEDIDTSDISPLPGDFFERDRPNVPPSLSDEHPLPDVSAVMREMREGLEVLYGPRLRGLYLFGSHACGEAEWDSDVDVLVVLDDFERYGAEISRVGGLASEVSLRNDASVSTVFVKELAWLEGNTPFLHNVREDAVTFLGLG